MPTLKKHYIVGMRGTYERNPIQMFEKPEIFYDFDEALAYARRQTEIHLKQFYIYKVEAVAMRRPPLQPPIDVEYYG